MVDLPDDLTLGAVYRRRVAASLERIWENVHDWEHLPYLHSDAFCGIELVDSGPWGWCARVKVPPHQSPTELVIDLRRDPDSERYHTRTLEGQGAGADTVVTLTPVSHALTDVRVEFWLPVAEPEVARKLGESLVALYTQLWDEDEAMMIQRQAFLDTRRDLADSELPREPIPLGSWSGLLDVLPKIVAVGKRRFRIVRWGSEILAHATLCPHRGGSLENAEIDGGEVVCPWHGYRFSLTDGRAAQDRHCRLGPAARIERSPDGQAQLVVS